MQGHVTVLGVLYIVVNIFTLFVALLILVVGAGLGVAIAAEDPEAATLVSLVASAIASCALILGAPGIIGGIGLLKYKNWARILVITLGALNLLSFPLGTILGVYTLWVLLKDETSELFA